MDDIGSGPISEAKYSRKPPGVGHPGSLKEGALSLASSVVIAMASVAPTLSVAVTLAAIVGITGYATPLVVLILTIPMLGIAIAYRRLNLLEPNCGSTYIWAAKAISPYFGFLMGWIMVVAYILAVLSGVMAIGPYVVQVFVTAPHGLQSTEAIVASLAIVFIIGTAYLGIELTARVQWALVVLEYAALGLITVLGLIAIFGGRSSSVQFSWNWFSWSHVGGMNGFVASALIVVFLFSGWDTAIALNEETREPGVNPGNAVIVSVIFSGLLFAFVMFALQGVVTNGKLQANGGNALAYVGQVLGGSGLARLMVAVVVLSAVGGALASLLTGTRIAFAMAVDSVLPKAFAHIDPKYKTPTVSTIVLGVLSLGLAWPYLLGAGSVQSSFTTVVSSDGLLFALFYAGTALTMSVYYRKLALLSARNVVELFVLPVGSAVFLLYLVWRAAPGLGGWTGKTLVSLYVMLGIGAVLLIYYRLRGQSSYFMTPRSVYDPAQKVVAPPPDAGPSVGNGHEE
jgi:amino acid transporter